MRPLGCLIRLLLSPVPDELLREAGYIDVCRPEAFTQIVVDPSLKSIHTPYMTLDDYAQWLGVVSRLYPEVMAFRAIQPLGFDKKSLTLLSPCTFPSASVALAAIYIGHTSFMSRVNFECRADSAIVDRVLRIIQMPTLSA